MAVVDPALPGLEVHEQAVEPVDHSGVHDLGVDRLGGADAGGELRVVAHVGPAPPTIRLAPVARGLRVHALPADAADGQPGERVVGGRAPGGLATRPQVTGLAHALDAVPGGRVHERGMLAAVEPAVVEDAAGVEDVGDDVLDGTAVPRAPVLRPVALGVEQASHHRVGHTLAGQVEDCSHGVRGGVHHDLTEFGDVAERERAAEVLTTLGLPALGPLHGLGEVLRVLGGLRGGEADEHLVGDEVVVLDGPQGDATAAQVVEELADRSGLVALPGAAAEPGGRVGPQLGRAVLVGGTCRCSNSGFEAGTTVGLGAGVAVVSEHADLGAAGRLEPRPDLGDLARDALAVVAGPLGEAGVHDGLHHDARPMGSRGWDVGQRLMTVAPRPWPHMIQ